MDLAVGAYEELRTFFRQFDPRHEREDEIFTRLGYIDVQFLAPRLFREYVVPYDKPMVDSIQRQGGFARIHCHGVI